MSNSQNKLGRLLITLGLAMLAILFAYETFASEDMSIVEVRKNIPLSDTEIVYKDFYIKAGSESGLKKNLVVTAVRKSTVKDAVGINSVGEVVVAVGQLKIISVQNHLAIAREYKIISRDEEPVLEQSGVMIGDQIDLTGSFTDNKKLVYKKPVAEVTTPAIAPAPVAAVAPASVQPAVVIAPAKVEVETKKEEAKATLEPTAGLPTAIE